MKTLYACLLAASQMISFGAAAQSNLVKTANGTLQGTEVNGIREFKGIPFAQPPVGNLRWREPQPAQRWKGIRAATHFSHRPMQNAIFGDMNFRADSMSEDCLYLNVWTPAKAASAKLPVLVYFYGGGLVAGDGSEPRYDGESLARKGIVTVTVNYRLGIFGFMAHPELTQESPHHSSSNYGYLDQTAALRWVQQNIAAFGGDPKRVTIAGESAGSISVSVQMASPLSKNLIAGAIGESGAAINPTLAPVPLAQAEQKGTAFAQKAGAQSLAELRAIPADQLLDLASAPGASPFATTIDGWLLPKPLPEIFVAGEQAHVPLLAGWNSAEIPYQGVMQSDAPTVANYPKALQRIFADKAAEAQQLYPGNTDQEVIQSATELSSDRFIVYSTWKWADLQMQTGGKLVYRYIFSRIRPAMTAKMGNAQPGLAGGVIKGDDKAKTTPKPPAQVGAAHASEIEYALGNLPGNTVFAWTPDDYKVSKTMESYFANFIKTGNPNGAGLPQWPENTATQKTGLMVIDVNSQAKQENTRQRYLFLDQWYKTH
ncbi:carboxylesterase/lipase family protein [Mucilaginibacter sp.]